MIMHLVAACSVIGALSMSSPAAAADDATEIRIMTLDPGHFHAALVQKAMREGISPVVHVYAPDGPDVDDHLARIEGFNTRADDPTRWDQRVYRGDDYLQKMLKQRPGNVVVISGNNRRKADYILACAEAGLHVLADKPMCVDADGYQKLKKAFAAAQRNGVLVYDIMTERSEITTILQKELMHDAALFGELVEGSIDDPAVVKSSVHHFFKHVAGKPLKRPPWYFDTTQQGEGIVDVTTHLVDLVMWECFPDRVIDAGREIEMLRAKRRPTMITREQYAKVTRLDDFIDGLKPSINEDGVLPCFANGEMDFTVRGVHAQVSVAWNFQAPPGAGDTHYSIIRGSKASVIIKQGEEEKYRPELYVEPAEGADAAECGKALRWSIVRLQMSYPRLGLEVQEGRWRVVIPDTFRIGHEAHFGQVMQRFMEYLAAGSLPEWEIPNMLTKYHTTTAALEAAGY